MRENEPKGIAFFNVKTGETHYARLEPQIQAYINSSNLGINASRGQDFGWRLAPEWIKKIKEFRSNENKMQYLMSRNSGQKVTTPQILYAIYGEQIRVFEQKAEENESPFEEEYLTEISDKPKGVKNEDVSTDSADSIAVTGEVVSAVVDGDGTDKVGEEAKTPSKSTNKK